MRIINTSNGKHGLIHEWGPLALKADRIWHFPWTRHNLGDLGECEVSGLACTKAYHSVTLLQTCAVSPHPQAGKVRTSARTHRLNLKAPPLHPRRVGRSYALGVQERSCFSVHDSPGITCTGGMPPCKRYRALPSNDCCYVAIYKPLLHRVGLTSSE
jgi:hypothetical protein